jgi:uncharacterized membrane protein YphA (DoxX/SURF4 family)
MDSSNLVLLTEAVLRLVLGFRFLSSGLDNVRRWPNPARTASIIFPRGPLFFGFVATALMVLGGAGIMLGFQTPLAALFLIVFLIPTFRIHIHWLRTLPERADYLAEAVHDEKAREELALLRRHAIHGHETGWRENVVLLAGCCYFLVRGCAAFGLDPLLAPWVLWLVR